MQNFTKHTTDEVCSLLLVLRDLLLYWSYLCVVLSSEVRYWCQAVLPKWLRGGSHPMLIVCYSKPNQNRTHIYTGYGSPGLPVARPLYVCHGWPVGHSFKQKYAPLSHLVVFRSRLVLISEIYLGILKLPSSPTHTHTSISLAYQLFDC